MIIKRPFLFCQMVLSIQLRRTWLAHYKFTLTKKLAPSHENDFSKPRTRPLGADCACNYVRLPLSRQHNQSLFESRFAPSRHFF